MITEAHLGLALVSPLAAILLCLVLVRLRGSRDRPWRAILTTGLLAALWPVLCAVLLHLTLRGAPPEVAQTWASLAGLPCLLLAYLTATIAARRLLTDRPGRALLLGLSGIAAALTLGWPAVSTYHYALHAQRFIATSLASAAAQRRARPVLAVYGIGLPAGYRVIACEAAKAQASFVYRHHRIEIGSDESWTPRKPLIEALLTAGYREVQLVADAESGRTAPVWINEPFMVDIHRSDRSDNCGGLALSLTRDDDGRFLGNLIPQWQRADAGSER